MGKRNRGPRPPPPTDRPKSPRFKTSPPKPEEFDISKWIAEVSPPVDGSQSFLNEDLDDTASVITAATVLEQRLVMLIAIHMGRRPTKTLMDSIFEYPGPISSLNAKIEVAYLLGRLTDEMYHDFHLVRQIRNSFCHTPTIRSFDEPDVSKKCAKFKLLKSSPQDIGSLASFEKYGPLAKRQFLMTSALLFILIMKFLYSRVIEFMIIDKHRDKIEEFSSELILKHLNELVQTAQAKGAEGSDPSAEPPVSQA